MATQPVAIENNSQVALVAPTEQWSDSRAKSVVLKDFQAAENFRRRNHDRRFKEADRLYLATTDPKTWEGTRIRRSAMPVFLALREIEAALAQEMSALFADNPPFGCLPQPGTTMDQARQVAAFVHSQTRNLGEPGKFVSLQEIVNQSLKSSRMYGNGPIEFGWLRETVTRQRWQRFQVPRMTEVYHPLFGSARVPNGEYDHVAVRGSEQIQVSRPVVRNVSIKNFYIDPNCTSHRVQDAAFCATRKLLTINELRRFRDTPGFNIPDDKTLFELSKKKTATEGDIDTAIQETYRGNTAQPWVDQSADPNLARVELICYWQPQHYVWLLGREFPAYNSENELGVLPFFSSFYIDVPDRWYAMSICDLVEGDQKLAMSILDARIDELSILVHPPLLKKRGLGFPQSQYRLRPFAMWEVDSKDDVTRLELGNVTQNAYIETDALERRTQVTTGNADVAALGVASAGGNSANRTAAGINTQAAATSVRRGYHIGRFEDQVFAPLLNAILAMDKQYLDPSQAIVITGQDGSQTQVDPIDILNADVHFEMRGSNKMRARQALQGGGLPLILQTYLNPEFIQLLVQFGYKVNMPEIDGLVMDTMNLPAKSLVVEMTPQEVQAYQQQQQQQMAPDMIRMMMQRERLDAQGQHQAVGDDTKLQLGLLNKLVTPEVAHTVMHRMGLKEPLQMSQDKAKPKPAAKK